MRTFLIRTCFTCCLLLASVLLVQAQRLDSLLNILDTRYPQEKLYLHFDRAAYNPGETIWFKAYLYSGAFPSPFSKTLYTELVDQQGSVLQRKTAPFFQGGAAAAFDLPADISSSTVFVRAYTTWMLNFDSSFIFEKALPVLNVANETKPVASNTTAESLLDFFPEGGDLVEGIPSRVAFKATDKRGFPLRITGQVVSSKNEKVADLVPLHDGMGIISFTPVRGEKYTAKWKDEKGKAYTTNLPAALKSGVVLEINNASNGINFKINKHETADLNAVYVVAHMHQQLLYRAKANLQSSPVISGVIPTENLPTGIVQVTVFTEDEKPLAERIVFVRQDDYYYITDLNMALRGLAPRGRNVIQIDVPDTIRGNLSVAVTDADLNPPLRGEDDIFSHLLVAADIKGYVHNAGYYFSSDVDSVRKHLDLVMMTNGWRRFKWEDVLAGRWPEIRHLPEDYLSINAAITGLNRTVLSRQEMTAIVDINGKQEIINIPLDSSGKISIPGLIFYDTAKVYYQFNNDKDRILTSSASFAFTNGLINKEMSKSIEAGLLARLPIPDSLTEARNKRLAEQQIEIFENEKRRVQTLDAVEVVAQGKSLKERMDEEYTSGLFSGGDGYTFLTEGDPFAASSMTVLNYLQGKVAGLQIVVNGPQASLSWRGGTPTLFLNEMMSDVNMIQSIPMTDVAMVKVFRPPFFGGAGGSSGGAIAVYTKKGQASQDPKFKGLDFAKVPGYTPPKQFFAPDYSQYDESHTQTDLRPTLYWNPFILTDKDNRRFLLTFYNNDITKRIRVVIEGINESGQITRIEKIFE